MGKLPNLIFLWPCIWENILVEILLTLDCTWPNCKQLVYKVDKTETAGIISSSILVLLQLCRLHHIWFKVNGYALRGSNSVMFCFTSLLKVDQLFQEKMLLPKEHFSFKSGPHSGRATAFREAIMKSQQLFHFEKKKWRNTLRCTQHTHNVSACTFLFLLFLFFRVFNLYSNRLGIIARYLSVCCFTIFLELIWYCAFINFWNKWCIDLVYFRSTTWWLGSITW